MNKNLYFVNWPIHYFQKWSTKGYSIFNSLYITIKIFAIPLIYSLVIIPTIAYAQLDTVSVSKNLELKELVVSSKLQAESFSELNRVVKIITREEIQLVSSSSIQDVLESVINIDIRQRGSQGVQSDMTFRGGSFDQVLVLLNGVNITDPQTGHHNLNIPIDLNSIQKIEVLQGPGARIYGPGAFSGAINIITKPDLKNHAKISLKAGEHGLFEGNLKGSLRIKKSSTILSLSDCKSNGYIKNTDFELLNVFLHTILITKPGSISFFSGYQSKGFGANSFYTPKYPNQYEKTQTFISSLEFEKKWNQNVFLINAYLRKHWDRFELFRDTMPTWYKTHNYHLSTLVGVKSNYRKISEIGRTQLGVEVRREGILSNVLGDNLSDPKRVFGNDSAFYTKGKKRYIYSIFSDHTFYINRFNVSAGVNYSYSNTFHSEWSYGTDLSYSIIDHVRIFSSVNRSFRNPTYTDLYYDGPTNKGNPNLKPETAITYEGGLKSNFSIFSGFIGYFHRDGRNIIDWIKKSPLDTEWQTTNYTTLKTDGVEISTLSNIKGMVPFINSFSFNYAYIWQSKKKDNYDSYYTLDFLRQTLRLGINHKLLRNVTANWNLSWQDREGTYIKYNTNTITSYKPFWLIDLRLSWTLSKYSVYVEASNLFNTSYIDIANVSQPLRWMKLGFYYNILNNSKKE